VLGIGRLHPQKDFALFIDVAKEIVTKHASVRFVIAGTGPEEEMLRARAAEHGLGDRLQFAGPVKDPRELYARASMLLLTSKYEGTPMVVLEAMAAGVPVVAPALDGICEILRDGKDAALAVPGDGEGFAARVLSLLQDPVRARMLTVAASEKVHTTYSAEAMARQVEAIYGRYLPCHPATAEPARSVPLP
jgi:glycosyltransferase involved in cell wall biosynthesis